MINAAVLAGCVGAELRGDAVEHDLQALPERVLRRELGEGPHQRRERSGGHGGRQIARHVGLITFAFLLREGAGDVADEGGASRGLRGVHWTAGSP